MIATERPFVVMKWLNPSLASLPHKKYTAASVNRINAMLKKSQKTPIRLYCLTDDASGLDSDIVALPMPDAVLSMIEEHGAQFGKLYLFSAEFRDRIGAKFIYVDLDTAITGDFSEEYDAPDELIVLRGKYGDAYHRMLSHYGPGFAALPLPRLIARTLKKGRLSDFLLYPKVVGKKRCLFNSSFLAISHRQSEDLWAGFDPVAARRMIDDQLLVGSDQAWLQIKKSHSARLVSKEQGFWFKNELDRHMRRGRRLPGNIKMVIFAGRSAKPWSAAMQEKGWVRELYGEEAAA